MHFRRLCLVLLCFPLVQACRDSGTPETPTKPPVRGLFYEIVGSQRRPAKSTVYLLGSIHVADDSIYPLPKRIEEAFVASPALVVEADVGDTKTGAAAAFMAAGAYRPGDGRSLKSEVSPRCYAEVAQAAQEFGLPMAKLDGMKPWMAAILLEGVEARLAGLNPAKGIDVHFLNAARGKKTIVELEGMDDQLHLFDGLSADQQTALLYITAKERSKFRGELDRLFKAWRTGNAADLEAVIQESAQESPELKPSMDALLGRRNGTMTEKIAGYLEAPGDHFVVVGAAHIVGPTGIVAQLQSRGFTAVQP